VIATLGKVCHGFSPSKMVPIASGVTRPWTLPSTTTAGAMLQAPRHLAFNNDTWPSALVSPVFMPNSSLIRANRADEWLM
jgi:hypothetical protein